MTCKETVTVNADAVDWLKKNYPELCIKAGLCERVGGTLYTRTFLRTTPPVPTSLKIKAPNESGETMCVVKWMAETPLGWVGSFRREALEQFYAPAQTPMQKMHIPPGMADPLDVVYAEGWNAACEKFGNPVFEPTPELVIELTKEVATPAQTPPPRLVNDSLRKDALTAIRALREWIDAVPKDTPLPAMPGVDGDWLDGVELALADQTPPQRLTDEMLRDCLRDCPPDAVEPLRTRWLYAKDFARAIETAVRKQFGVNDEQTHMP